MLPIFKGFLSMNQIASGMNQELFGPFKERNRLPQPLFTILVLMTLHYYSLMATTQEKKKPYYEE